MSDGLTLVSLGQYIDDKIVAPLKEIKTLLEGLRMSENRQEVQLRAIIAGLAGVRGKIATLLATNADLAQKIKDMIANNPEIDDELSELAQSVENINGDLGTVGAALGLTTPEATTAATITPETLPALPPEVVTEAESQVPTGGTTTETSSTGTSTPIEGGGD
jgi:hypothetical protein